MLVGKHIANLANGLKGRCIGLSADYVLYVRNTYDLPITEDRCLRIKP